MKGGRKCPDYGREECCRAERRILIMSGKVRYVESRAVNRRVIMGGRTAREKGRETYRALSCSDENLVEQLGYRSIRILLNRVTIVL